jgi:hypothetical protein
MHSAPADNSAACSWWSFSFAVAVYELPMTGTFALLLTAAMTSVRRIFANTRMCASCSEPLIYKEMLLSPESGRQDISVLRQQQAQGFLLNLGVSSTAWTTAN